MIIIWSKWGPNLLVGPPKLDLLLTRNTGKSLDWGLVNQTEQWGWAAQHLAGNKWHITIKIYMRKVAWRLSIWLLCVCIYRHYQCHVQQFNCCSLFLNFYLLLFLSSLYLERIELHQYKRTWHWSVKWNHY